MVKLLIYYLTIVVLVIVKNISQTHQFLTIVIYTNCLILLKNAIFAFANSYDCIRCFYTNQALNLKNWFLILEEYVLYRINNSLVLSIVHFYTNFKNEEIKVFFDLIDKKRRKKRGGKQENYERGHEALIVLHTTHFFSYFFSVLLDSFTRQPSHRLSSSLRFWSLR